MQLKLLLTSLLAFIIVLTNVTAVDVTPQTNYVSGDGTVVINITDHYYNATEIILSESSIMFGNFTCSNNVRTFGTINFTSSLITGDIYTCTLTPTEKADTTITDIFQLIYIILALSILGSLIMMVKKLIPRSEQTELLIKIVNVILGVLAIIVTAIVMSQIMWLFT